MLHLFSGSAYALESRYYNLAKERIYKRLDQGLDALSEAEIRPRHYTHVDAGGFPTMWLAGLEDGIAVAASSALTTGISRVLLASGTVAASGNGPATATGSKVAVIPVQGTVQKRGGYCSTGTKQLSAMLSQANRDDEVLAIVLDIDSPGGAVDGTEEFANLIRSSKKPVVAYIDGLGASAAYWIASQASYIYINSETTGYAGSLGVLCTHIDQTAALEKNGQVVTILRSSRATDKARFNGVEPLTDELKAQITADLDSIANTFIASVERGRAGKLNTKEDVFTGKVYNGSEAKKHGLVDAFGSLQDAVNKAAQLGRSNPGGSLALATSLTSAFTSTN
jgi:protease-4